jgi:hypothetical protein
MIRVKLKLQHPNRDNPNLTFCQNHSANLWTHPKIPGFTDQSEGSANTQKQQRMNA